MAIRLIDEFDRVDNLLKQATKQALKRCGVIGVSQCKANCKVDTGKLRRGHKYRGTYKGDVFTMTIGNTVDYSIYVEFKPENKGGRPWFRKSLEGLEEKFIEELRYLMR